MPDPDFQLKTPDLATGYRSPRLFNTTLTLDPQLAALAQPLPFVLDWHLHTAQSYSPLRLGLNYRGLDDVLSPYLANLSTLATQQPNSPLGTLLPPALAGAGTNTELMDGLRDAVADFMQDKTWAKIPGRGTNIVTGEKTTIGSIDPSGTPKYDGLDSVVPGTQLKSTWLMKPITLGKRFGFASGSDVYFKLYVDKDAFDANKPSLILSGGSITIDGKTSDGLKRTLTIVGGRDQTGGPTGAVVFEATFW